IELGRKATGWPALAVSPDGRTLATGHADWGEPALSTRLWELSTGKLRRTFKGHSASHTIKQLVFSADGKTLASCAEDSTVLLWDVHGDPGGPSPGKLTADETRARWEELDGSDAASAFAAMRRLIASPEQTVRLLKRELRPVPKVAPEQVTKLLADLDAE